MCLVEMQSQRGEFQGYIIVNISPSLSMACDWKFLLAHCCLHICSLTKLENQRFETEGGHMIVHLLSADIRHRLPSSVTES